MIRGSIRKAWDRLAERAERIELRRPLDARSHAVYLIILAAMLIEGVAILASDFSIGSSAAYDGFAALWLLAICGVLARRYGHAKIGGILEGVALPPIIGVLTLIATILLSAISAPFADAGMIAADRALGFDWLKLLNIYLGNRYLMEISNFAYRSMFVQLPLVSLLLFATGNFEQGWKFVTAWALASVMTALLHPFFPAIGAVVYFHIGFADIPHFNKLWPWQFGAEIAGIKNGSIRNIGSAMMGIVQFPSFHMAAAVMFAWYARILKWFGVPFIILNCAMGFSTIISGNHYLVDVMAGAALAVLAIGASSRLAARAAG